MKEELHRYRQAISCFNEPLRTFLSNQEIKLAKRITEIRLRINRPVCVYGTNEQYFLSSSGQLTSFYSDSLLRTDRQTLDHVYHSICEYSVYCRQNEIAEGFVTLRGGHRAGICGTAVIHDDVMHNIRDVSSLNLRFAREKHGCADRVLHEISDVRGGILICGAPNSGKTTVLRDLARQLSYQCKISLIDERGELAACVNGEPQNDVGLCDVYCGYPKSLAMIQAVRSMAPEIIVCDEIGSVEECEALEQCRRSGVAVIATVHACKTEDLTFRKLLKTNAFSIFVFLENRKITAVKSAGEYVVA